MLALKGFMFHVLVVNIYLDSNTYAYMLDVSVLPLKWSLRFKVCFTIYIYDMPPTTTLASQCGGVLYCLNL